MERKAWNLVHVDSGLEWTHDDDVALVGVDDNPGHVDDDRSGPGTVEDLN